MQGVLYFANNSHVSKQQPNNKTTTMTTSITQQRQFLLMRPYLIGSPLSLGSVMLIAIASKVIKPLQLIVACTAILGAMILNLLAINLRRHREYTTLSILLHHR